MKVFISQPMNGRDEKTILDERAKMFQKVQAKYPTESIELIDSYIPEACPTNRKHRGSWYLGKSLEFLSEADLAVFAPGFEKAKGCLVEYITAKFYGIPTYCEVDPNDIISGIIGNLMDAAEITFKDDNSEYKQVLEAKITDSPSYLEKKLPDITFAKEYVTMMVDGVPYRDPFRTSTLESTNSTR